MRDYWLRRAHHHERPLQPAAVIQPEDPTPKVITIFMMFLALWQFLFNISNKAMDLLIKFFKKFLLVLANFIGNDRLRQLQNNFPSSHSQIYKLLGLDDDAFTEYVLCPTCYLLYHYKDCVETTFGRRHSKKCIFVNFPDHPHRNQREPCNTVLLTCTDKLDINNELIFIPKKTYPYCSLKKSLARIVYQTDFMLKSEEWRGRLGKIPDDVMGDVYDAQVWKDFMSDRYDNFLQYPGNLLLSINCDWFQPFSNTQYSVGALYLTILNLPRKERNKLENIILVSVIPGPREPKMTLNPLLVPLVEELKSVYNGWQLPVNFSSVGETTVSIRACIASVVCDIPAMRKLCGFLGHSARLGCSKCLKQFPKDSFSSKTDYSGFDVQSWTPRTLLAHKFNCDELNKCTTKTDLHDKESEYGCRYSLLLDLTHFDPIRFGVVDFMHNMLLGTPKHMFSLWVNENIISQQQLQYMQNTCEKFLIPYDTGRIPVKIGSHFSGFTADQWKMWTTVLSGVLLKGILPERDYRCWMLFVNACRILSTRIITIPNIHLGHSYLLLFCRQVQDIYGWSAITPNNHLHLHVAACMLDYGPVHSMWCFPFERFNKILGSYHTNNKNIEAQIMKKFLLQQKIKSFSNDSIFEDFQDLFTDTSKGSLGENDDNTYIFQLMQLAKTRTFGDHSFKFEKANNIHIISNGKEIVLSSSHAKYLHIIYQQLYPQREICHFSQFCVQYNSISIGNEILRCNKKSGVIMAYWPISGYALDSIDYSRYNVGTIQFFVTNIVKFKEQNNHVEEEHLFCFVQWKQRHLSYDWFGQSAVVSSNLNQIEDACCFMPVQRIANRCASAELEVDFGDIVNNVFIACPINLKYNV